MARRKIIFQGLRVINGDLQEYAGRTVTQIVETLTKATKLRRRVRVIRGDWATDFLRTRIETPTQNGWLVIGRNLTSSAAARIEAERAARQGGNY